jgi:PhnB protein
MKEHKAMTDSAHIRHGFGAVRPYLYGRLDLADFVKKVFDAEELERVDMGDGFHLELQIADSVVVLEVCDAPHAAATQASVYVYVQDVDSAHRRAISAGASSIAEPEGKPYSERSAGVRDTSGNTWWISTYKDQ